jgi:hypothetical protein
MDTTNSNRAESLARALESVGLEGRHQTDNRDGRKLHYVTVWTPDDVRYPSATVWVDEDGYTWGHNFEHSRHGDVATTAVADAIKATLNGGE